MILPSGILIFLGGKVSSNERSPHKSAGKIIDVCEDLLGSTLEHLLAKETGTPKTEQLYFKGVPT